MKGSFIVFFAIFGLSFSAYSFPISYCSGSQPTAVENTLLQSLIPSFAAEMGCEAMDDHCIQKWEVKENSAKFSITWKKQCGPVINGVYQLGDEGHGSTFVCGRSPQKNKTCCWPLGYDYVSKWLICTE